jgi:hypothetical protein
VMTDHFRTWFTIDEQVGWTCTDNSADGGLADGEPTIVCVNDAGTAFVDLYTRVEETTEVAPPPAVPPVAAPEPAPGRTTGETYCGPAEAWPSLNITITGPSNDCANAQFLITALWDKQDRSVNVCDWGCGVLGAYEGELAGYVISCNNTVDGTAIRLRPS